MDFNVPRLYTSELPESEQTAAFFVEGQLLDFHSYVIRFGAVLSLFDYGARKYAVATEKHKVEKQKIKGTPGYHEAYRPIRKEYHDALELYREWMRIAARDGAMVIYHFGKSIEALKRNLHQCPTLEQLVSRDDLRLATNLFREHFPRFETIRDAVGHQGELTEDPKSFAKNSFTGVYNAPGIQIGETARNSVISDTISGGRKYIVTNKGKILSYEVSRETLANLASVKDSFYDAFRKATPALQDMMCRRLGVPTRSEIDKQRGDRC
jgi:hypothetical protein